MTRLAPLVPASMTRLAPLVPASTMRIATGVDRRELIFTILYRVEAEGAFSTVLLHRALERRALSPPDQAFVTEVVLGTLRQRGRLDYALAAVLSRPLEELPPRILTILRMGLYQVLFLDRVPGPVAVAGAVELARRHGHPGTTGLVNAVLRRLVAEGEPAPPSRDADAIGHVAVAQSHPRWLVERWVARLGLEEAEGLCAANNTPPPSALRVNVLKAAPEDVARTLAARGLSVERGVVPEALRVRGSLGRRVDLYEQGLVTMQDEASMLVTHLLGARPGETVLDATAAPGGKATHLGELMRNQGRVIAADVAPEKLRAVSRHAARLGLDIVEAHHLDAREAGRQFRGQVDRALVDAPCTGTGVIRRRPEIRWRVSPEALTRMAAQQRTILDGVAPAVKAGGTLVYGVCSLEPEEGPQVVEDFLGRHAGAWSLRDSRTLFPHRDGTDGFFMARLERAGSTPGAGRERP